MFSYKELNNDDEIIKNIKIHLFKYIKFIIDNVDISLLNISEFIEDFTTNKYIKNFSILFISMQYFELGLKILKEYENIESEESEALQYKHQIIRKANFYFNEGYIRLNYKTIIESMSNIPEEIINYYNKLKKKFKFIKLNVQ